VTAEMNFKAMKDWREEGNMIRELEFSLVPHSCGLITPWLQYFNRDISRPCRGVPESR